MAKLIAIPIDALSIGKEANNVKADETDPTLTGHSLNMFTGVLTLTFSETVLASSLKSDSFTIHGGNTTGKTLLKLTG
jgi:hypothetical protein